MKISSFPARMALIAVAASVVAGSSAVNAQTNSDPAPAAAPVPTTPAPATPPPGSAAPAIPYGVSEVVKMYQGGIGKDIIIHYINNTTLPYHLSADNMVYLQNLGMPQEITKAIISRDGQLQQQAIAFQQSAQAQQQPQPPPANGTTPPPGPVETPSTQPPSVTVIQDAPVYPYPYYDSYYGPYWGGPIIVGGGWGWGWGRGGWHGGGGFHGGGGGFHGGGGGHGGGGHH